MDWKTLLANLIGSLAWPAAVVTIVILLREPISKLVTLLRKLKWNDFELTFAERLAIAEREADASKLPAPKPVSLEAADDPAKEARLNLRQLAVTAPSAAIAEAWRQLEWRMRDALRRSGVQAPDSPRRLPQLVHEHNLVPEQVMALIADLRVLRNQAVHGQHVDVDTTRSLEYLELAERVALSLPGGRPLGDPGDGD